LAPRVDLVAVQERERLGPGAVRGGQDQVLEFVLLGLRQGADGRDLDLRHVYLLTAPVAGEPPRPGVTGAARVRVSARGRTLTRRPSGAPVARWRPHRPRPPGARWPRPSRPSPRSRRWARCAPTPSARPPRSSRRGARPCRAPAPGCAPPGSGRPETAPPCAPRGS